LAVIIADPRQPSFRADLAYLLLNAYIAYSGVVFPTVSQRHLTKVPNAAVLATAADIVWVTVLTGSPRPVPGRSSSCTCS
jgi:hypothetical protein